MTRHSRRRRAALVSPDDQGDVPSKSPLPTKPMGEVRPVGGFATWLRISLYGFCLFCVVGIVVNGMALAFFADVESGKVVSGSNEAIIEGARIDQMTGLVALGTLIVFLSSAIAYGTFFRRSLMNLQAVHEADPEMRPFGVWAWYFVPIASLWKPLNGFSEVRDGSRHAEGKKSDGSALVGLWWMSWLGYNILSNVGQLVLNDGLVSGDLGTLSISSILDIGSMAFGLVAAFLLARFAGEIARGQEQVQFMSSASAFD